MLQDKIVGSDILLEFLEVAFHQILFFRNIYPKEIFTRKKVYGISANISQHPELNEYLTSVLNAIRELILENSKNVQTIKMVFYNENKIILENFVFDLLALQSNHIEPDPYYLKTEESLRTICLKLAMCNSYLKPLPEGSTFSIEIETYESAHIALSENPNCEDFPWIVQSNAKNMVNKNMLPINTVKTESLTLQMYVLEDSDSKNLC